MLSFTSRLVQRALGQLRGGRGPAGRGGALASPRLQAVPAGALLGGVVWALAAASRQAGESDFRLAMALTVVVAGSTAFVLYVLHGRRARAAAAPASRHPEARACAVLLGCSLAGSLELLQRLLG